MPDPTQIDQIQEQKAQEAHAAAKRQAVEQALMVLDLAFRFDSRGMDYLTLVDRLRHVLDEELAVLTAPPKPKGS